MQVTSDPGEHVEAVGRAARRPLRAKGFRSTTLFVGDVVHVLSDDAHAAIDPEVKQAWIDQAPSEIMLGLAGERRRRTAAVG